MELTIEQMLQQAVAAHKGGRLQDAERLYRAILQTQPRHPHANHNLGVIAVSIGQPSMAIPFLRAALEADSSHGQFWLSYIDALITTGQRDQEAFLLVERELQTRPSWAEALGDKALTLWVILAEIHQSAGNLPGAIAALERAHGLESTNVGYMVNLGEFLRQDGQTDRAIAVLEKATKSAPDHESVWVNLGAALQQAGRLEAAKAAYGEALKINPQSAEVLSNLGAFADDANDWDSALHYFERALAIRPNNTTFRLNKSAALTQLGRFGEAETLFREAIVAEPNSAEAHRGLGYVLGEQGLMAEAAESYQRALNLAPRDPDTLLCMADHALFLNAIDEAVAFYERVAELDPINRGLKAGVYEAVLHYTKGEFEESRARLESCKQITSAKGHAFKNYRIYWRYLRDLLARRETDSAAPATPTEESPLYIIGESHCLGSQHRMVRIAGRDANCQSLWIPGCKQWHLGNARRNKYKHKFEEIMLSIPQKSSVLLVIGEIDCRSDEGILAYCRKNREKSKIDIVQATIDGYLDYVSRTNVSVGHDISIQGVPSPNFAEKKPPEGDIDELRDIAAEFNAVLSEQCRSRGFGFLDVHALTDRGDGLSNGIWHMDEHHLSPEGIEEAWRRRYRAGSHSPGQALG